MALLAVRRSLWLFGRVDRLCAYQLLAPLSPPGALGGDGSGFDKVDDQMLYPLGRSGNQIPT